MIHAKYLLSAPSTIKSESWETGWLHSVCRWVGEGTVLARRPWTVSPPILGGLNYGDRIVSDTFPLVWGQM